MSQILYGGPFRGVSRKSIPQVFNNLSHEQPLWPAVRMLAARALPYGPNHSRATFSYFLDALEQKRTGSRLAGVLSEPPLTG